MSINMIVVLVLVSILVSVSSFSLSSSSSSVSLGRLQSMLFICMIIYMISNTNLYRWHR